MAVNVAVLIAPQQVSNSQTTYYTSTGMKTIIDKCTVTNVTAGVVTVSINLVTSGGAAGVTNLILDTKSLAVDECYTCPEIVGQILGSGDFISAIASAATSITIRASGRQVT